MKPRTSLKKLYGKSWNDVRWIFMQKTSRNDTFKSTKHLTCRIHRLPISFLRKRCYSRSISREKNNAVCFWSDQSTVSETDYVVVAIFLAAWSFGCLKVYPSHNKLPGIEVKMFYGASTIKMDSKSAVGGLLKTARKYVRTYGPGAMLFSFGFGEDLAATLEAEGVLCLDCSGMVELGPVEAHQRTWCADRRGNILP